jgi:hypothetical protein
VDVHPGKHRIILAPEQPLVQRASS